MASRFSAAFLAAMVLIGTAAQAQTVDDARRTSRTPWSPEKVTAQVIKACAIPRAYFTVDREFDGFGRLRESPSVTPDQHKCAVKVVSNYNIPIRK